MAQVRYARVSVFVFIMHSQYWLLLSFIFVSLKCLISFAVNPICDCTSSTVTTCAFSYVYHTEVSSISLGRKVLLGKGGGGGGGEYIY